MKRVLIPAACSAALVLFSGIAQAHGGGHWHGGPRVGLGVWVGAPVVIGAPYFYPPPYAYGYGPPVVREYIYRDPDYRDPGDAAPIDPPAPQWYYCRGAGAYYPYVKDCPGGWEAVPAHPADKR